MACGERIERDTRVWTWCKKWGVPYPCRKIKKKIWYSYAFHQLRYVPSTFPFWQKREGCCERVLYKWKKYVWWNTPKPYGWTYHDPPVIIEFKNNPESGGQCPPREGVIG